MNPLRLLKEFWAGVQDQVSLMLLTQVVWMISKLTKPKLAAWTEQLQAKTDAKFGAKADVVQRAVADNLEVVVRGLRV